MVNVNKDLEDLVNEPREALDVEIKEWLELNDSYSCAALAKEIIALANHGGGYLVVGFKELEDGTYQPAQPYPTDLSLWSQDAIQSVIAKYIDPSIQCRVRHVVSEQGETHPIIQVPGGHRVPVRAKAGSPDGRRLMPNRVYIRRAGPNSEEPRTTEEWDRFFERLVQNRRDELLDSFRSILAGVIPTAKADREPTRRDQLANFQEQAIARWSDLVASLPPNSPPRFSHGHYDSSFAIDGDFDRKSLTELNQIIRSEVRNHSGWPPFLTIGRVPYHPRPVDGAIECWMGHQDTDGAVPDAARSDFWRISPDGLFFTRRGYQEDSHSREKPGTTLDITTPTWRLGEAVLEAGYIATALNATDANLICHARWTGLSGRYLVSHGNPNRWLSRHPSTSQREFEAAQTIAVSALPEALPEMIFAILRPLYELFEFFPLSKRLVEQELASMRKNVFAV